MSSRQKGDFKNPKIFSLRQFLSYFLGRLLVQFLRRFGEQFFRLFTGVFLNALDSDFLHILDIRDHSCITSAKRVGGVRKF